MALVQGQSASRAMSGALSPGQVFGGTTSFHPATSYAMLVEMFGHPDSPNPISPEALSKPLQPDDILGQYVNRELKMVSNAITALVLNDRASIMNAIFPRVETLETTFTISSMEPNMVPWSRVTNFGIPRELTYQAYAEAYTTQRKKQMFRIEKNFLLDPNYGPDYARMLLTTLAANANLTLNLESIVQAIEQPFRNQFYSLGRRDRVDHVKLRNAARATMGIANRNQQAFFNALIKAQPDEIEIAFDTVLGPAGVFSQLRDNDANAGGPITCEKIEMNPETKRIQAEIFKGPRSSARITVAGRTIELIELDTIRVNSRNKTDVYKPFITQQVFCDIIPFEVVSASDAGKHLSSRAADVYAYSQTPQNGGEEHFEFSAAMRKCFLFDEHTGEPSARYHAYVRKLNAGIVTGKGNPTAAHPKHTREWQNATSCDDEDENITLDTCRETDLDKNTRLDALTFRNTFFAVTYNPKSERFELPHLLGDYHLRNLKTERLVKLAEAIMGLHKSRGRLDHREISNAALDEVANLALYIRRQPWTAPYVNDLRAANQADLNAKGAGYYRGKGRRANDGVPQWPSNDFGALNLPENAQGLAYPPGFASWAGIQTLAAEADRDGSPWQAAGIQAKRAVESLESLYVLIADKLPNSELVEGSNTAPWFHVDDNGRSVLFDTLVQMRSGRMRPGPVFLQRVNVEGGLEGVGTAVRSHALTIAEADNADAVREAVRTGRPVDAWLNLGDHYSDASLVDLKKIVSAISDLNAPNTKVSISNGTSKDKIEARKLHDYLQKELLEKGIGRRSVEENTELINELVKSFVPAAKKLKVEMDGLGQGPANDTVADSTEAAGLLVKIITEGKATGASHKRSKSAPQPVITEALRAQGAAAAETSEQVTTNSDEGAWLRAPLVSDSIIAPVPGVASANPVDNYTSPAADRQTTAALQQPGPVQGQAGLASILSYPPALSHALGTALGTNMGAPAAQIPRQTADPMDYEETSQPRYQRQGMSALAMATHAAMTSFGATDADDLNFVGAAARSKPIMSQPPASLGSGGTLNFFGPWEKRLKYLRANVSDGATRLVALAALMSRNTLQTQLGAASVGVPLMMLEIWRTGILEDTAALVRLIRGSQTGFSVVTRTSVVPTLEGVTGDYAVTGEMFHGVVFPNRKNIDIMLDALLVNHIGGRYSDYMDDPKQLLKHPSQTASCLVMVESAETVRREYPCQLFGLPYYYQAATRAPSAYTKRTYNGWAHHILGDEALALSDQERQRVSYWNKVPRSFVGDSVRRRILGDHDRFDVIRHGTGGIGRDEFNHSNAWEAFMGGQTPTIGESALTVS